MKRFLKMTVLLIFTLIGAVSCDDDDVTKVGAPTGDNVTDNIIAVQGENITFEGTFETLNGFKSIHIYNEELLLDKTINFANPVKKYYLDYSFAIPVDANSKEYVVTIDVENITDESESFTTTLDVASPPEGADMILEFISTVGSDITISGTITDIQGLTSIELINEGIGLNESIDLSGTTPNSYDLIFAHNIPLSSEDKVHKGTVTVTNINGRSTTWDLIIDLSGGKITYDNVYIVGGFQIGNMNWNANYAYPMEVDAENEGWFETTVFFHGENDEFKFVGQQGWSPNNWGLVDQNDPSQGMKNADDSQAIKVGTEGAASYRTIRFNPYTLEYSVSDDLTDEDLGYTTENPFVSTSELYIVGKGYVDYPSLDWNPSEAIMMTNNPNGISSNIFIIENLVFDNEEVAMKFIGQKDWSPLNINFAIGGERSAPTYAAINEEKDGGGDAKFYSQEGTYTVMVDWYLKKVLVLKQ